MQKLSREDLHSLETYAGIRQDFRAQVMEHKKPRRIALGANATLYFEDRITMQYQIQEMLRAERIFEAEGIQEELDAYNPLIPDGNNWKATFMLEYPQEDERRAALSQLIGIEDKLWVQVDGFERSWAIADEDLERDNAEKTSSVHFVRFELSEAMCHALKNGSAVAIGIDHAQYQVDTTLNEQSRASLVADLS